MANTAFSISIFYLFYLLMISRQEGPVEGWQLQQGCRRVGWVGPTRPECANV